MRIDNWKGEGVLLIEAILIVYSCNEEDFDDTKLELDSYYYNLFITRCTIKKKKFDVIIDGDSCENMIPNIVNQF